MIPAEVAIPLFVVSFLLSFLLSGMETGLFALSRMRIRQMMRTGNKPARMLHDYLGASENFLMTILVGNTLANMTAFALLITLLMQLLERHVMVFTMALLGSCALLFVLMELLPKTLFQLYPNRLCLALVRPFRLIHVVLAPAVGLAEAFSRMLLQFTGGDQFTGKVFGSRDELRLMMPEKSAALSSEERDMIKHVLDLEKRPLSTIARPLEECVTVRPGCSVLEALDLCRIHGRSRLPVIDGRRKERRVVGVFQLKRVLYEDLGRDLGTVEGYSRVPRVLPETMTLDQAWGELRRTRQSHAVVSRAGHHYAFVTQNDILKVMFGEVDW